MQTDNPSFTIRLPQPSAQQIPSVILVLLIVLGLVQTVQLFALSQTASTINVGGGVQTAAPAGNAGSGSSLPSMVGGC